MTIKEKLIKALTIYKDRYIEENGSDEGLNNQTELKGHKVGAYFSNEKDPKDYCSIKFCTVEFYNNGKLVVAPKSGDYFPVDVNKWLDAVISELKIGGKTFELEDFKLEVSPVISTNTIVDDSIVKAKILDDLLNRNISFNK
jgi:hypothetical protein